MKAFLLFIIVLVCAGMNDAMGQWTTNGSNIFNSNAGNVGIGNSSPSTLLHVGKNMTEPSITIQNFGGNGGATYTMVDNISGANWKFKATNTGGFKIRDHANLMDVVVIEPSSLANSFYIKTGGNVGIGTANPTSKFHVLGNILSENGSITINNPTAILQLQSAGVNKGFMQLSGNNLRIGTNSGNTSGKFIVRMNGQEHVTVDSAGNVGIGTSTPETQLQVDGPGYVSYTTNGPFQIGSTDGYNMAFGKTEILTRSSGNPATFYIQQNGGDIQIGGAGVSNENPKVHIRDGSHASLVNAHGHLLIGETDGLNLAIGHYEILARDNGTSSPLYLQQEGGAVRLGGTGLTASGTKLHITDGVDAGLATHGFLLLGLTSGANIVMDNNEIIARNNGSASTLYLQNDGGTVQIGAHTTINHGGNGEVLRLDGVDPNIGFYQSGVFKSFLSQSGSELFMGNNAGRIHLDGTQVAIGVVNANAGAYKLTVSGKIICEEVKVELYAAWPDYVFHEDYDLKTLYELKSFIQTHKHLPEIPKAEDVAKEGVEIGEMNRKLLEKVEELTLYIIQLQEQIDDIKKDMKD